MWEDDKWIFCSDIHRKLHLKGWQPQMKANDETWPKYNFCTHQMCWMLSFTSLFAVLSFINASFYRCTTRLLGESMCMCVCFFFSRYRWSVTPTMSYFITHYSMCFIYFGADWKGKKATANQIESVRQKRKKLNGSKCNTRYWTNNILFFCKASVMTTATATATATMNRMK